jgi:two-component system NarL family sensor kinase
MSTPLLAEVDTRRAARGLAFARLAVLPVIFASERLDPGGVGSSSSRIFDALLVAAVIYSLATLVLSGSTRQPRLRWLGGVDVVLLAALASTSGGTDSEVRRVFFFVPVAAAFIVGPLRTAGWSALAVLAYLAVAALDAIQNDQATLVFTTYLGWTGVAATILATVLTQRSERIGKLAEAHRHAVARALDAQERERQRLAEALHDHALPDLITARQDLAEIESAEREAIEGVDRAIARTLHELRPTIRDLHPLIAYHRGLAASLRAIANREAHRGGYSATVHVDPEAAGLHDRVLVALVRELLANVTRHAGASRVDLGVSAREDEIVLEIEDDGRGFEESRPAEALDQGHIGLVTCAERVDALGGSFVVSSKPGYGTRIVAKLPTSTVGRPSVPAGPGEKVFPRGRVPELVP